jgi:murein DD-endopeptidase MepM/ murein hydrolase activator NlpD
VFQKAILSTLALLALTACATTPTPYASAPSYASRLPTQPSGPNIFASAAFASLHGEMTACNAYGSNIGAIGARSEVIAYSPYIDTPAGALMRYPTEQACLSSGFGWRDTVGVGREHTGIDLANPNGGFVYAAGAGRVVFADWRGGYGLALELDHGHGVHTFYGHLNEIDVRLQPGVSVPSGAPVARMGATGNATGVHLHYEVIIDGLRVDPLHYGLPEPTPPVVVTAVSQDVGKPIE